MLRSLLCAEFPGCITEENVDSVVLFVADEIHRRMVFERAANAGARNHPDVKDFVADLKCALFAVWHGAAHGTLRFTFAKVLQPPTTTPEEPCSVEDKKLVESCLVGKVHGRRRVRDDVHLHL